MVEQNLARPESAASLSTVYSEVEAIDQEFTELSFLKLDKLMKDQPRYIFLHDTFGKCAIFFRYKANLIDFAQEIIRGSMPSDKSRPSMGVKIQINDEEDLKKLAEEKKDPRQMERNVMEPTRKMLVHCMRDGAPLMINIDKLCPDFHEKYNLEAENFPSDLIFDQQ